MGPIDFIIIGVIIVIVGGAIAYIVKKKKGGAKCIGCPYAGECGKASDKGGCTCDCSGDKTNLQK